MSYNPPSSENDIRKLNKSLGVVRNIARFTNIGTNNNVSPFGIGSTAVAKTMSFSLAFQNPVVCEIKTVSGKNHLSLQTSNTIADGTGSSLTLDYLDGTLNNGQYVIIRPQKGKTLVLNKASDLSGNNGNLYLNANITLTENQYAELYYYHDLGTGTSGMYITSVGSSGGSSGANTSLSNLITTAINQTLLPNADFGFNIGENSNTNPQTDLSPNGTQLRWGEVYTGVLSTNAILFGIFGDQSNDLIQYTPPVGMTNGFIKYNVNDSSHIIGGVPEIHSFQIGYNPIFEIRQDSSYSFNGINPAVDGALSLGGIDTHGNPLNWFKLFVDEVSINDPVLASGHHNNMLAAFNGHYMSWNITNNSSLTNAGYEWFFAGNLGMALAPSPTLGLPNLCLDLEGQPFLTGVGAAGSATALPSNPWGYLLIIINGNEVKIPYYHI